MLSIASAFGSQCHVIQTTVMNKCISTKGLHAPFFAWPGPAMFSRAPLLIILAHSTPFFSML